jgi:uncharacterized protein
MKRDDLLDLNDVLQHPGRKLSVDIETAFEGASDFELTRPLTGYLEAISTGNLLLLTGEFKAGVIAGCARCNEPLEVDVQFELDEQFPVEGVPSSYSAQDFARVAADEEPYQLFEGNSLMVEALLRQDLIVAIPVQPLCQYGWDGDCPIAKAKNLKQSSGAGSGRLDVLRQFKTEESEDSDA